MTTTSLFPDLQQKAKEQQEAELRPREHYQPSVEEKVQTVEAHPVVVTRPAVLADFEIPSEAKEAFSGIKQREQG